MKLAFFRNGWWFPTVVSESVLLEPHLTEEGAKEASRMALEENKSKAKEKVRCSG